MDKGIYEQYKYFTYDRVIKTNTNKYIFHAEYYLNQAVDQSECCNWEDAMKLKLNDNIDFGFLLTCLIPVIKARAVIDWMQSTCIYMHVHF